MIIGDLIAKVNAGQPLSEKEAAFYIRHYPPALAAFMIENNPGSVNFNLRRIGYSHLGFEPNPKALARQMQIFIDRANNADWMEVVRNFHINPAGLSESFLKELQTQFGNLS
jgi:hypothetical protein